MGEKGKPVFTRFFYLLRERGLPVSMSEWITLMEGLTLRLHENSLSGFYDLCRAVLVKSETDYDKFDTAFLEYFKDVSFDQDRLPEQLMAWLEHPEHGTDEYRGMFWQQDYAGDSKDEILNQFAERLGEQNSEHNGGAYWIGTEGFSQFGNSGYTPQGLRVGGESRYHRALQTAGERKFKDFRSDNMLDIRQFQMAFRLLRQYSSQNERLKTEFDVDHTIRRTCDSGGMLRLAYRSPRRNTVKVLMLMDSGGSISYYSQLCSMLFQAARQSHHFKELQVYYFHNCISAAVYTDPRIRREYAVSTEWVLKNYGSDYRVIIVGDALMDLSELMGRQYDPFKRAVSCSGTDWLRRFADQHRHLIWLNPAEPPQWGEGWGESYGVIAGIVDMYPLSLEGLERGLKKLMIRH